MNKNLRNAAIVFAIVVVGIQFVSIRATNPNSTGEIATEPEIAAILERSCYDCHSNETDWPWYGHVAPVSWWIVHHVDEAREEMNFSEWDKFTELQQQSLRRQIWRQVEGGHMPLPDYLRLHKEAKLSETDKDILRDWAGVEETSEEHDHGAHEH